SRPSPQWGEGAEGEGRGRGEGAEGKGMPARCRRYGVGEGGKTSSLGGCPLIPKVPVFQPCG
ncbi:MAG: hypothetical protein KJ686_00060, partial [Actinobacteria bacterium]|nr:hypothetical protein [Actinomycetota bacterium]